MNGLAEVIPIASRRGLKKRGNPPPQVTEPLTAQTRRRRLVGFCAVLIGLVLALVVMDGSVIPHRPAAPAASIPQELRRGLYQRALDDVVKACSGEQARAGLLRQHCVEQARFLQQLPECTGDCDRLARGLLNHH
jgi:hypothetical protein